MRFMTPDRSPLSEVGERAEKEGANRLHHTSCYKVCVNKDLGNAYITKRWIDEDEKSGLFFFCLKHGKVVGWYWCWYWCRWF
jgi:hypothetical protein